MDQQISDSRSSVADLEGKAAYQVELIVKLKNMSDQKELQTNLTQKLLEQLAIENQKELAKEQVNRTKTRKWARRGIMVAWIVGGTFITLVLLASVIGIYRSF